MELVTSATVLQCFYKLSYPVAAVVSSSVVMELVTSATVTVLFQTELLSCSCCEHSSCSGASNLCNNDTVL